MASSRNFSNKVSVSVQFENLSYHIPVRGSDFKSVLKCLNGNFLGGKLNVILGQSGSGKSSLLNILAGYITENVSGDISLNGKPRDMKWFNKVSTYIMQNDLLQPNLTFRESMMFSANFKLGSAYTQAENEAIVEEISDTLRMKSCLDLMPHQMSGGERKRCSIALELVNDPPVIFLDEPTSGLDNVSAKQCIELLKSLTNKGKTVICSMHQPSDSDILLFDHIFLLHDGNCIYTGTVNQLVPYLSTMDFNCPIMYNPIDYVIEIASANFKNMEKLVEKSKELHVEDRKIETHITRRLTLSEIFARNISETENLEKFPTSYCQQICILTKRQLLQIVRNKLNLGIQLFCYCFVGLVTGLLYIGTGKDGASMPRTFVMSGNLMFFILISNSVEMSLIFPGEIKILKRENFNRWYRISPYYISHFLISIPFGILWTNIVTTITYIISDQPLEFERYLLFVIPLIVMKMAAQALGMIIGSLFNMKNGAILAPCICSSFFVLSVHGMGYGPNIEPLVKFVMNWNFARAVLESMMLALVTERSDITCNEDYCHFKNPNVLLRDVGIIDTTYTTGLVKIIGFVMLFKILGYFTLKFRLTNKYWEKMKIIKNKYS